MKYASGLVLDDHVVGSRAETPGLGRVFERVRRDEPVYLENGVRRERLVAPAFQFLHGEIVVVDHPLAMIAWLAPAPQHVLGDRARSAGALKLR